MAKTPADIRSLARRHTETSLRTLVQISASKKAPAAARVAASTALLDRGWGKATQPHSGDAEGGPIVVEIIQRIRGEEKK